MSNLPQQGIARIGGTGKTDIRGAGFLVSSRYVMTAAHVVNEALARAWNGAERPTDPVSVEFPFGSATLKAEARVTEWHPPADHTVADVAVLQLDREVSLQHYVPASSQPRPGQAFRTWGFPDGQDSGMDAKGTFDTTLEFGLMKMQAENSFGFFIGGGFSGGPLLDLQSGSLLGMVVQATRDQSKRTAFALPIDQIERAWPPMARPYKGLATFQESDARFFRGRQRYVDELANKLERLQLVAVIGRSGSGKSSLVRAGLIPRLRARGGWNVVTFRPGSPVPDPFRNLAVALLDEMEGPIRDAAVINDRQNAAMQLADILRGNPEEIVPRLLAYSGVATATGKQNLIVVDQFEELFTSVTVSGATDWENSVPVRFVRALLAASGHGQNSSAARCVVTLRADYLGLALGITELVEALRDADVKIGPMNASELQSAIEDPARALGVEFEPGLVQELVKSVGTRSDALPLLEFALADLWARQQDRKLTRPPLDQRGSDVSTDMMSAALERHAETVHASLSRQFGEAKVRKVILDLTWVADPQRGGEDARRPRLKSDFEPEEWAVVERLAAESARLVTIDAGEASGEPVAELVHESLIGGWDRLQNWLEEDRSFRLWLQRTEERAAEWKQDPDSSLLEGRRLEEALRWQATRLDEVHKVLAEFIRASKLRQNKEQVKEVSGKIKATEGEIQKLKKVRFQDVLASPVYDSITGKFTHPLLALAAAALLVWGIGSLLNFLSGLIHIPFDNPIVGLISNRVIEAETSVTSTISTLRNSLLHLLVYPVTIAGLAVQLWIVGFIPLVLICTVWFCRRRASLETRRIERLSELDIELGKRRSELVDLIS
jgi:energy-coupling factor transporter ATP-binding protein EcfA2